MGRGSLLPLAVLAAALAVVLLLATAPGGSEAPEAGHGAPPPETPAEALRLPAPAPAPAPAGEEAVDPSAPRLMGRAVEVPHGPVEVTLVARDGTPIPGAVVLPGGEATDAPLAGATTDEQGVAWFRDLPWDGSLRVAARGADVGDRIPPSLAEAQLRGPALRLEATDAYAVRVLTLDTESGRPVDVEGLEVGPAEATLVPPRRVGEGRWLYVRTATAGRWVSGQLRATARPGHVAWETASWSGELTPYARSVEVRLPLRPEADVRVSVLDHEGAVAWDAEITAVAVAGRAAVRPAARADGYGQRRLAGIPFFRDERITVQAGIDGTTASASVARRLGELPTDPVLLEIRLPPPEPLPDGVGAIGIGGGGGSCRSFRCGRHRVLGGPRGAVAVVVRRHDGSPAVGATVRAGGDSGQTDERGRVRLENLPPGETTLTVEQVGLLPIAQPILVEADQTIRVEVREPKGRTRRVEVVDEQGRPLPFARLQVGFGDAPAAWIDERGGVLRVDGFTDERGHRLVDRLDDRAKTLEVTWSTRRVVVPLGDGEETHLRVVLPPEPDAPGDVTAGG